MNKQTWKPTRWVAVETEDLYGETAVRVLSYFEESYGGQASWKVSEPTAKPKDTLRSIVFTDTQDEVYDCKYAQEGLNQYLADKYDAFKKEQGQLFDRRVKLLCFSDQT